MALRDVTNAQSVARPVLRVLPKYEPHVVLDVIYAHLIRKGVPLHLQCNTSGFTAKRAQGCKNMDLWVDGLLSPQNPLTCLPPSFRNLKGFIEFCCHRDISLLGYTIGSMEYVCSYCARLYVVDAFVPLSCGCHYHPPCIRALILSWHTNCLGCGAPPHGTWMAYLGSPLDERMSTELEEHRTTSMTNDN